MNIKNSIEDSAYLLNEIVKRDGVLNSIQEVADLLVIKIRNGGKIIFAGNGGSASQADHIAGEFVGRFLLDRPSMPAMSLSNNSAVITAIANNFDYTEVFSRQLDAFGQSSDVFVCLSTSGKSKNLIKACDVAISKLIPTVCLVGFNVSELSEKCDYKIHVPSYSTPKIQEAHIVIGHILAEYVERELYAK